MKWAKELSIIVPIGKKDPSWTFLLKQLKKLPKDVEIIFSASEPIEVNEKIKGQAQVKVVQGKEGRAKQLNLGASQSSRALYWFLHSDSQLTPSSFQAIERAAQLANNGIFYFDLGFFDGPRWMAINSLGVWLRSHWLKLPFGDQGFLISKKLFWELGGYDESALFGEDHLLIWKAHERGIPILPVRGKILTSGRKYSQHGWLKTTIRHLSLTYQQAKAECLRIYSQKKKAT